MKPENQKQLAQYELNPKLTILTDAGHGYYVKNEGRVDAYGCYLRFQAKVSGEEQGLSNFDSKSFGTIPAGSGTSSVLPDYNKLGKGTWEVCRRIDCSNFKSAGICTGILID